MMRTGWMLLLLLSLGLNIGLGYGALKSAVAPQPPSGGLEQSPRDASPEFDRQHRREGMNRRQGQGWSGDVDPESLAVRRSQRLGRSLGLDDRQRDRLCRVQAEALPEVRERRRAVAAARRELHRMLSGEVLDRSLVWEASRRLSSTQAGLDSLVLSTLLAEVETLDPAQRRAYFERLPRWAAPAAGGRDVPPPQPGVRP